MNLRPFPENALYQISDDGRIQGPGGKWLAQHKDRNGYLRFSIWDKDKKRSRNYPVHRVVCLTFHGQPPTVSHVAGHRNGYKLDNRADNLRWCTPVENEADKAVHGTVVHGEKHPCAKLTGVQVLEIRDLFEKGTSRKALGEKYKVGRSTIHNIINGITWKHI